MKTIVYICYSIVAVAGTAFALIYLFRSEFMPYHAEAVGADWNEVEFRYRVLITALMIVCGGGWLAVIVALFYLLFGPYRRGVFRASVMIFIIGFCALLPALVATLYVKSHSPAHPPWILTIVLLVVLITGFVISVFDHVKVNRASEGVN